MIPPRIVSNNYASWHQECVERIEKRINKLEAARRPTGKAKTQLALSRAKIQLLVAGAPSKAPRIEGVREKDSTSRTGDPGPRRIALNLAALDAKRKHRAEAILSELQDLGAIDRSSSEVDALLHGAAGCLLQVEATVKRRDLPLFKRSVKRLVQLVTAAGLDFKLSGFRVDGDDVHFINYWDLDDPNSLFHAEVQLPDSPAYGAFDQLIVGEIKNIVFPIHNQGARLRRPPEGPHLYMKVVHQVRPSDLAELAARMEASVPSIAAANRWYLGDAYLGLTGQTGRVVQMWLIPENQVSLAINRLAGESWLDLSEEPPVFEFFEPSPGDLADMGTLG